MPHELTTGDRFSGVEFIGDLMISTDGSIAARLVPLTEDLFNCFDSIDGGDDDEDKSVDENPVSLFDSTGYGANTFEKSDIAKQPRRTKNRKAEYPPLPEYTTPERRIDLLTRPYEPSDFDKNPRPKWISPRANNDNHRRKHSFPALDEARNNLLMAGVSKADTLLQNEWAFDILLEIRDLMNAAAPPPAWLQHDGHGEADESEPDDQTNPGYGIDAIHDYGPSEIKVKRMWEHGNDNKPSEEGEPWTLGTVELISVPSEPSKMKVKALHKVGQLELNERNQIVSFRTNGGRRLEFKTKTRGTKGKRAHSIPDPADIGKYDGAALPRNRRGELRVGFFGGRVASSNSMKPDTSHYMPMAGPTHSASDPWAAQIATEAARDDANVKLSQCRLLVGEQPYEALTQAACGFRIGELCGGRLGNTTDSARNRSLLQVAIERIIEARTRTT